MGVVMSVKPESPGDFGSTVSARISESESESEKAARGQASRPAGEGGTDFPHELASVGAARHALADALQRMRVAPSAADDAVLILSELVSNALRHARPLTGGTIRVAWWMEDSSVLRIAVTDGGRQHPGHAPGGEAAGVAGRPGGTELEAVDLDEVDESAVDGRGLGIVGLLADAWGVEPCPQERCDTVAGARHRGRSDGLEGLEGLEDLEDLDSLDGLSGLGGHGLENSYDPYDPYAVPDPDLPKTVWAAVRLRARHAAPPPPQDPPRRWWRRLGTALGRFPAPGRIRGMRGARLGGARLGQARGGGGESGPGSDTAWVPRHPAGVRMAGA